MRTVCLGFAFAAISCHVSAAPATVRLSSTVMVQDVQRIGVNLGAWTSWGAEQLSSNVIKNPGFEGNIDRAIVVVRKSSAGSFEDDQNWLGRPDGFWTGADFDVRSGSHAGEKGRITDSRAKDRDGFPAYFADVQAALNPGDIVMLTRRRNNELPANWWFNKAVGVSFSPAIGDIRPGSEGRRSLRIRSSGGQSAQLDSYLDAIGDRAGKLLPVQGTWTLSFWGRLETGSAKLGLSFQRDKAAAFLLTTVPVTTKWQRFSYSFTATDKGPPGILDLRFQVVAPQRGDVLLDDVELRSADDTSPFRHQAEAALAALHPAYLRDWQGQLGDTFENRVASEFSRQTSRYRPGTMSDADYGYSLPEFLVLAKRIGASPWISVPPTFSEHECADLGRFLYEQQKLSHYSEVLVEFGNENWNYLFRPAGIPFAQTHGVVADQCFAAIRKNAVNVPLHTVINAQHANPDAAIDFAKASQQADIVAVAPYFLTSMDAGTAPATLLPTMFSGDGDRLLKVARASASLHKQTAVYEVNMHTNGGSATESERTPLTSGAASGAALATRLLDALALGVKRQCVWTLSGFDNHISAAAGFVRLWGVTRDLAASNNYRPSALAVLMLNAALAGDMVQTQSTASGIHGYGFRKDDRWSAILTSSAATQTLATVQFPDGGKLPANWQVLSASSPLSTNEDGPQVKVETNPLAFQGRVATVKIPAYGLVTLVGSSK